MDDVGYCTCCGIYKDKPICEGNMELKFTIINGVAIAWSSIDEDEKKRDRDDMKYEEMKERKVLQNDKL
jgi:hypothetical protein